MRDLQPLDPHSPRRLSLLALGCSKSVQTTTTTTTAAGSPPRGLNGGAPRRLHAPRRIAAFANGPGVVGDTSQTAALSAPAKRTATPTSPGVAPPSR